MKHQWIPLKCKVLCINIPQCHLQQNILPFHGVNTSILHICGLSVAAEASPNPVPTKTHLVCDPQPQTNQIGIIHNVPVGEGGSFGASCCPLEDTGHYAITPPFLRVTSEEVPQADSGVTLHYFLLSDLGDCFYFFNSTWIPKNGPTSA